MPDPVWIAKPKTSWLYGVLEFSEFHTQGIDLHVSYPRDLSTSDIHVSFYEAGSDDKKYVPPGNLYMNIGTYGITLNSQNVIKFRDFVKEFPTITGYSNYGAYFTKHCSDQAFALGIIAKKPAQPKPSQNNAKNLTMDNFPTL